MHKHKTSKHGTLENNPRNRYIYMWEGEGTSKHGTVENNPRNYFIRVKDKEI